MDSNIFTILNLPYDATEQEVDQGYTVLNAELSEKRFASGEEGNSAARALNDLNTEYRIYKDDLKRKKQGGSTGFEAVDSQIKLGNIDAAQSMLDQIMDRNGEWHYMQSIIFYKRDWITECRKHLTIAVNLEPTNAKYKSALQKLDMVMSNGHIEAQYFGNNRQSGNGSYARGQQDMLCNCMLGYCLAQLCCRSSAGRC
ncbi:MAG: hypothetical protein LBU60_03180 [Clostridiales bacterium]|jgi:molecular chaperone DnaJ|nr:hypothetical protein [Clostridiales bacterium]